MVGGQGVGEEDLPAGRAKHNVIQTPVIGGGGAKGQKDAEGSEGLCCRQWRRGGENDKAGRSGHIADTKVQAQSTGSHSYYAALARSSCPHTQVPDFGQSHQRRTDWTQSVGQNVSTLEKIRGATHGSGLLIVPSYTHTHTL